MTGDKKGDTYSYVLSVIKYFFDQNCPTDTGTVLIDFEKAVMNSFWDILPGWKVANCYFHLCQSVQKNISKKFKVRYFKDKIFARAARLVAFLAFVPVADVEEAFFEITFYIQSNRPKPSVQEYFRAIKEQQVVTDYHLDRLAVGKTPSKKRRISSSILYDLCSFYTTYPTKIEYLFAVAKYFGNNIE